LRRALGSDKFKRRSGEWPCGCIFLTLQFMNGRSERKPVSLLKEFDSPELLDLLADGAYITDLEREIVCWNGAAQRITGWSAEEVVGRHCRDNLLVHVDKDGHALCGQEHCPLHRCIVTGQPSSEPLLVFAQHRSGRRIPVEVTVSPIRNHAGAIIGGIEVFRDLTASVRDQLRAREIQEFAVKCDLPNDDRVSFETRYQPRDIVGGDFFRIEKLDEDYYGMLAADAMGHGVSAALYTLLLRSLWDEHRADVGSPTRFVTILNQRLNALVRDEGYFGTAVFTLFNAANGQLSILRAGHPAPFLFRSNGMVETVGEGNPALGLSADTNYRESQAQMELGDALLIYSDGATEVFDAQGCELGREGLLQLIRAQHPGEVATGFDLDRLEEQLLQSSNQLHLPDDLTLIKLRRLDVRR